MTNPKDIEAIRARLRQQLAEAREETADARCPKCGPVKMANSVCSICRGRIPEHFVRKGRFVKNELERLRDALPIQIARAEAAEAKLAEAEKERDRLQREIDEALQVAGGSDGCGPGTLRDLVAAFHERGERPYRRKVAPETIWIAPRAGRGTMISILARVAFWATTISIGAAVIAFVCAMILWSQGFTPQMSFTKPFTLPR